MTPLPVFEEEPVENNLNESRAASVDEGDAVRTTGEAADSGCVGRDDGTAVVAAAAPSSENPDVGTGVSLEASVGVSLSRADHSVLSVDSRIDDENSNLDLRDDLPPSGFTDCPFDVSVTGTQPGPGFTHYVLNVCDAPRSSISPTYLVFRRYKDFEKLHEVLAPVAKAFRIQLPPLPPGGILK